MLSLPEKMMNAYILSAERFKENVVFPCAQTVEGTRYVIALDDATLKELREAAPEVFKKIKDVVVYKSDME